MTTSGNTPLPGDRDRFWEMMVRIDERTQQLVKDFTAMREQVITKAEFESRFKPVQMIVFGLVALFMTGVVGAILAQVVRNP